MPIENSWGNQSHERVNKTFAIANSTNKTRVRTHSNLHKIINKKNNSNSIWRSYNSISYDLGSGWDRFNSFSGTLDLFWDSYCSTFHRQNSNWDRFSFIRNSSNYYGYKPNTILNSYGSKSTSTSSTCYSFNSITHCASFCFCGTMAWIYFNNDLTNRSCLDFYKTYNCIKWNTSRVIIGIPLCFNKHSAFNQIFPFN